METKKYIVRDENDDILMEYTAPDSSRYSSALATIKGYEKEGIKCYVFFDDEVLTKERCEYILN